jgi:aminoglycoside phosphotransferase (APT) family kinase protein
MNDPDIALRAVLAALGVSPRDYIGHGGEARVYALSDDRIVRVLHDDQDASHIERRRTLTAELLRRPEPRSSLQFNLPDVLDVGEVDGRWYTIERRLEGASLMEHLPELGRADRDHLLEQHLEVAASLGRVLHLETRGWFGELLADEPVRSNTWRGYLRERAAKSIDAAPSEFSVIDPEALADDLPDTTTETFVHLDVWVGNMLAVGTRITAVLDIGVTAACGDPALDPLAAAVYLSSPEITPVMEARDAEVASSWLRAAGLDDRVEPTRRWLAAYWCAMVDDRRLYDWCRSILLGSPP